MLKHVSVDRLLKSILALFALATIGLLALSVRGSWHVLNENSRAESVVAASRQIFTALINQRPDRSGVQRFWESDQPMAPESKTYLTALQNAEMPALAASLSLLGDLPFDGKNALLPELRRSIDKITALQAEF
jgi:hypothetical protein